MKKKEKPYTDKQSIYVNVEGNVKEALEDICYKERMTLTAKIHELIKEEVRKKAMALEENPARIAYSNDQSNDQKTIISFFASFSDRTDIFHRLKDENTQLQDFDNLDRKKDCLIEGMRQYKANLLKK